MNSVKETGSKRKFPGILVFLYTESYDAPTFQYAVQQKVDGIILKDQLKPLR